MPYNNLVPTSPSDFDNEFRRHFDAHYDALDLPYESLEHAYEFGFQIANTPKFKGRKFHDVESDVREEYVRLYPGGDWDRAWDALFYGWEKAGGAAGGVGFI